MPTIILPKIALALARGLERLVGYLAQRQLLVAGQAQAIAEVQQRTNVLLVRALGARRPRPDDVDVGVRDAYRRD